VGLACLFIVTQPVPTGQTIYDDAPAGGAQPE
jgi:hypothetical protein